jgi:Bacterial conjugation TrbI-like protein
MRKAIAIVLLLVLVAGAGVSAWFIVGRRLPKRQAATSAPAVAQTDGLQQPSFHSERAIAPADAVVPQPTPEIAELNPAPVVQERAAVAEKKLAPMRIYASTAAPEPTPEEEDLGDYAPAFRMVRCKLVNTIDSSNISTPVFGLVTDDLVWDGKIIIAKCSEVHGLAQVDKSRERIAAEGAWTFTLFEPNIGRLGNRELVVKGYALDREDDPEFKALMVGSVVVDPKVKTWGITDGSAGLRGVVLRSNNAAELNLFVATFIAGIAQSVQGTVTNVFGQTVASPNVNGAGGVPGYIINPPAQGVEAVLDRYAQMVMDSIERDGFFIRVPAGKLFYVYVTEDILTGKATVGGSRRLRQVQSDFLDDRTLQERVTQPRAERDARAREEVRNAFPYPPINPALTQKLDEAANRLEHRSEELQTQSQQLAQPSPAPTQAIPNQ